MILLRPEKLNFDPIGSWCIPLKTLVQVGGDAGEEHLTRVGGGGRRACVQLDVCIKRERERERVEGKEEHKGGWGEGEGKKEK